MEQSSFGYWLRLRRKALDLTRERLADRVGYSAETIRKIEIEQRRPSAEMAERLAEIFNIPQDERTAFLRFARGDWRSVPIEIKKDIPWHVSTESPRSNLPASISSLVGREQGIADIRNYLSREDIRLVTLIGPPGIGKTRLSIETARTELSNFPEGVFFVALAPLKDPPLIVLAIIQALGYVESKNLSVSQQLVDGIGEKQMLIVLDNCEHLIQEVAEIASELLSACSRLKLLTTSREALRIPGEWLYSVPALEVLKENAPIEMEAASTLPSLTLFAERARAVRSDFVLDANNVQAVASICAQLDGLPLAIELMAARIRLMSPQTLLTKLNDQFVLYADGMRVLPTRQKTLHNAIDWSYNLLSVEEQRLFARLSVFSGGFTLEAAESIFSRTVTDKSITDLIASLLDKSLLQRTLKERGEPRFNMLVTIQHFALTHLRQKNDEIEVRNRHLDYFLDLAEQVDKEIHGPAQVEWMERLELEHDNLRTALDWCVLENNTEFALRLLCALGWTWIVQNHHSEMRSWFDKIHVLPDTDAYPAHYAGLLNHMGRLSWMVSEYKIAQSLLKESQRIWQKLGVEGERGLAQAFNYLSMVARWSEGDNQTAQSLYEQSLQLYQKHGDRWGIAFTLFNLGWIAYERDEDALAVSLFEQSLEQFRQFGDLWGMGRASQLLGQLLLKQGNYEKARMYFDQHLRLDEKLHFTEGTVNALFNLGGLYRYQGEYDRAGYFYQKSLNLSFERGLGGHWYFGLYGLGMVALHQNNYSLARQHFIDQFNSAPDDSKKINACDLLTGLAAVAAATSQHQHAARLFGAVEALFETTEYRLSRLDQAEFDRHIQIARNELGETRFEALAVEGRAMTMEQAIEYALELATS